MSVATADLRGLLLQETRTGVGGERTHVAGSVIFGGRGIKPNETGGYPLKITNNG